MNVKSAKNVEGHLIYCADDVYRFRVYSGADFIDYDISHSDLLIKIIDEDAAFYDNRYLEHSPETLGIDAQQELFDPS